MRNGSRINRLELWTNWTRDAIGFDFRNGSCHEGERPWNFTGKPTLQRGGRRHFKDETLQRNWILLNLVCFAITGSEATVASLRWRAEVTREKNGRGKHGLKEEASAVWIKGTWNNRSIVLCLVCLSMNPICASRVSESSQLLTVLSLRK